MGIGGLAHRYIRCQVTAAQGVSTRTCLMYARKLPADGRRDHPARDPRDVFIG